MELLKDLNRTVGDIKDKDQFTRKLIIIFDGFIAIFLGVAAIVKLML
jgi:hypothetical protein